MQLSENIIKQIKLIPGEEGFWSSSSGDTFVEVAKQLVAKGFTEEEALDILTNLYFATANCYGD